MNTRVPMPDLDKVYMESELYPNAYPSPRTERAKSLCHLTGGATVLEVEIVDKGKVYSQFYSYLNGKPTSRYENTLHAAIITTLVELYDGRGSRASDYIFKMLGMTEEEEA